MVVCWIQIDETISVVSYYRSKPLMPNTYEDLTCDCCPLLFFIVIFIVWYFCRRCCCCCCCLILVFFSFSICISLFPSAVTLFLFSLVPVVCVAPFPAARFTPASPVTSTNSLVPSRLYYDASIITTTTTLLHLVLLHLLLLSPFARAISDFTTSSTSFLHYLRLHPLQFVTCNNNVRNNGLHTSDNPRNLIGLINNDLTTDELWPTTPLRLRLMLIDRLLLFLFFSATADPYFDRTNVACFTPVWRQTEHPNDARWPNRIDDWPNRRFSTAVSTDRSTDPTWSDLVWTNIQWGGDGGSCLQYGK